MSTQIDIEAMESGVYGVRVTDGSETTSHRVTVSPDIVRAVAPRQAPGSTVFEATLVRESFEFLLEREPAGEILETFDLDDITRYFPEYPREIVTRFANLE